MRRLTTITTAAILMLACSGASTPDPAPTPEPAPEPASEPDPDLAPAPELAPEPTAVRQPPSPAVAVDGPPWSVRSECEVPQLLDADGLFREASSGVSGLSGGMVLCEVVMSTTPPKGRRWDLFGNPPDPSARLVVGEEDRGRACADDTMQAILSWPSIMLSEGDKLKLSVVDVDMRNDDSAGVDVTVFEGHFPVDLRGGYFSASCRGLSAAVIEAGLSARIDAARGMAKVLRGAMLPDPLSAGFGFPVEAEGDLRRHITDVAARVGWEHDRVSELLEIYESLQETWSQLAGDSVRSARRGLAEIIEIQPGVSAAVEERLCEARGCLLRLRLTSGAATEAVVDLTGSIVEPGPVWAVMPDGRDVWLEVRSPSDGSSTPITLAPGGSVVVELVEPLSHDPVVTVLGREGVSMLRLVMGGQHRLLAVPD
ncbi:MAG: hypothetical protein ACI8S6_001359 [Myxococcota bacterium]|jgi:hypothetical protein